MKRQEAKNICGDLIVAFTGTTDSKSDDRQEIYNLVADVFVDLFHNRSGRFKAKNCELVNSMNDSTDAFFWQ